MIVFLLVSLIIVFWFGLTVGFGLANERNQKHQAIRQHCQQLLLSEAECQVFIDKH